MRKKLLGVVLGLAIVMGGVFGLQNTAVAAASGCDDYAIMYCGASSPQQFINKVNNDGRHRDHKPLYANFGLAPSEYGKFVRTAKHGTLRQNGDIVVGGVVVGRSTQNVGRVHDSNFNQRISVGGNTYWGGPFGSTYHANTADVMVMFNDQGVMQFAVISSCGNPQRITPNKPSYDCNNLKKDKVDKNTYRFTTNASAGRGAEIVKVVYDFGDGTSRTVSDPSQPVQHTFKKDAKVRATVYVRVPGGNVVTTSGPDCIQQIKFEKPPEPNPQAQCKLLQATLVNADTRLYRFVATASVSGGAKFKSADIDFGDSAIMRGLKPNGNTVTVRHAYAEPGNYTATATLYFTAQDGREASATCQTAVTPEGPEECKPGVPVGSPECEPVEECVPDAGKGETCELTDTGPGLIAGIFGGVATLAGAGHYLFRKYLLG